MHFRRIFEERHYDVHGRVLPLEDFRPFADRNIEQLVQHKEALIQQADPMIGRTYEPLTASEYRMFKISGNRSVYEKKYFKRRHDLLAMTLAEHAEGKGRYTDSVVDLLWAILEETTWVVPAHNPARDGVPMSLPYAFRESADYIDLFAATTAADLSFVYFFLKNTLGAVSPLLCERLLYELRRRIVKPFLNRDLLKTMWWSGLEGRRVNNWNPWIISNILTVIALTDADTAEREAATALALELLNYFSEAYFDDGGCDEGPSYWSAAGAALYDACCLLYDLTDGYVNMFDDPLIRRMGEYKPTVYVHGERFLNFADSPARLSLTPALLLDWGYRCSSDIMISAGRFGLAGGVASVAPIHFHPYRYVRLLTLPAEGTQSYVPPLTSYLDGIGVAITREYADTSRGLYLAFKGGHNNESHNHNDVGTFTVFSDGRPVFVDAGSGAYTKRTFGPHRYDIWSMRSDYHNLTTVNNYVQITGENARACNYLYEKDSGKLSMELTSAYPTDAGLSLYTREASLTNGRIRIVDVLQFKDKGTADFHLLVTERPTELKESSFTVGGCTVTFDPTLTLSVEACDHTIPETQSIATAWGTDSLYRITLSAKEAFCSHTFVLTVYKAT